tara:strand:+ start:4367 stop:4576 length:210 start_codon:yes stop_codon:yes gene_type:complete
MGHLKNNNETYLSHLLFAGKIGLTLIFRGVIFILHAIFPFCKIPNFLNLKNTSDKLHGWNKYTIRRERK